MASLEHRKPSTEFIHSFYSGERKLFSRMASSLKIDSDLAFKIISYWLWLEENINKDIIHYIRSLSDDGLQRISSLGEQVLTNAGKSGSSTAKNALSGVDYFLEAVCCKAIDDLKDKAEYEKAKKALEELDLQEFLCKPDSSLAKSYLSSEGGASTSSSTGTGKHPQSINGLLSSIPESSSSRISKSQAGNHIESENGEVGSLLQPHNDYTQNSTQLSASAKAFIPSSTSHATSLPVVISVNNFPAPVAENKECSAIVPYTRSFSTQSGAIVPHLPAFSQQTGAVVPHVSALVPQNSAIMPHISALTSQNGAVIPHMPTLVPHSSVFVQHMPALAPQNGSVLPHIPTLAPQSGIALQIPGLAPQSSMIVQQIPAFSSQGGPVVAHIPIISPQSGANVPSQNGANVFQSPPGDADMVINAQNIPQPDTVIFPPRRLHPDERTLFVTFSNGSPLTEDELFEFFQVRYEINAESIYIEEPNSVRPPQYAHVTFFTPEHVEFILKGQAKVKFRANGKHLWARRFIPRRRRKWGRSSN